MVDPAGLEPTTDAV